MDEQRQEAYLNLIESLLKFPNGEEVGILDANQDLIDIGLVQVMRRVAKVLAEREDENAADFLINTLNKESEG